MLQPQVCKSLETHLESISLHHIHTNLFSSLIFIPKFIICFRSASVLTGSFVVHKIACLSLLKWKIQFSILSSISVRMFRKLSNILYTTRCPIKITELPTSREVWGEMRYTNSPGLY